MQVEIVGIDGQGRIQHAYAGCRIDAGGTAIRADGNRIGVRWSLVPSGTRSFTVLMVDRDAPVDQAVAIARRSRKIDWREPIRRRLFFHWLLIDIPADVRELAPGPKPLWEAPNESKRPGVNDLTYVVRGGKMETGYFGPCPPIEDPVAHRYEVHVFGLNRRYLNVPGDYFDGGSTVLALRRHAIGHGVAQAGYSPSIRIPE
jgi:phosphatidylethanolamine-binding protein (PEBP) family uncharacterized protein